MNEEKQRILIAEACGWKDIEKIGDVYGKRRWEFYTNEPNGYPDDSYGCGSIVGRNPQRSERLIHLPDYLNDLNAMNEAESILEEGLFEEKYVVELGRLFYLKGHGPWKWSECPACIVKASAEQRAEAFLKTIGKWEDEE